MVGKSTFSEHYKRLGIQSEEWFVLGEGAPNDPKRFHFSCALNRRKPSHLFAVFCDRRENLFIAWNLKVHKAAKKTVFSLSKESVNEAALRQDLFGVTKKIEFSGWNEETVFVFSENGIDDFLKYVSSRQS